MNVLQQISGFSETAQSFEHIDAWPKTARREHRVPVPSFSALIKTSPRFESLQQFIRADYVDPVRARADVRLLNRWGVENAVRDGVLPWRRVGAATVVLVSHPDHFHTSRDRLRKMFGTIVLARCRSEDLVKAAIQAHEIELVQRAETRTPIRQSCRQLRKAHLQVLICGIIVSFSIACMAAPVGLFTCLLFLSIGLLCAATTLKLLAVIFRFATPNQTAEISVGDDPPLVSVLLPLFKETDIANALVKRMQRLTYPKSKLDVCLVVEASDTVTANTLSQTDLPDWMRVISVPDGSVQTKPRAMNFALDFCKGDYIGIYDAEDAPAPDQIEQMVSQFQRNGPELGCVQGVLDFYNPRHNWISRCFSIEYATWFRTVLPGIQRLGLIVPLGGTTLFFPRHVLDQLGGWDAHNVTEDADLGVRLARAGYRTDVISTATMEEANSRAWPWIKQRSRWLKGYAMTYAVHMLNPRALYRDVGFKRFIGFQIQFGGTIMQFVLAPVLWSLWLLWVVGAHPMIPPSIAASLFPLTALFLTCEAVNIMAAAISTNTKSHRHLWPWIPTLVFYFPLATLAVYKAIYEMATDPFYWDKTEHGQFHDLETT